MSVHIVTAALIPGATQAAAPADEPVDGTPFTALLGEHMQAAQTPEDALAASLIDATDEPARPEEQSESAPEALLLGAAFVAETPREEQSIRLSDGRSFARAQADATAIDPRQARSNARAVPAASNGAAVIAAEPATEPLSAAGRGTASFELPAAAQTEAPSPSTATQAMTAQQSISRPVATAVHTLQQPVGSERWTGELGHTVQILVRAEQQSATLHVTPPELGPIDVQIDMSGDQASLSFTVQNPDTRNALENALPRLRDMLAEGGIALGDAQVNQQSGEQRETASQSSQRGGNNGTASAPVAEPVAVRARMGLVDTFA